jgi:hypothetical protein
MAYPRANLLRRWDLWRWLATATLVTLLPAMAFGMVAALSNSPPGQQTLNRAAKADALVSSAMRDMRRDLRVSWDQSFRDRTEPRSNVRIAAESPDGEKIAAGPALKARFAADFE